MIRVTDSVLVISWDGYMTKDLKLNILINRGSMIFGKPAVTMAFRLSLV